MAAAIGLARRGLGTVWPNPAVGCILVRHDQESGGGGRVVGRGWTQSGGRPHAETEALARTGAAAAGATVYVTLEPCNHHGKTPPCSEALIAAGIRRAVIAHEDPDPRVSGSGIARLRAANIDVAIGVGAEAARAVNAGFLSRVQRGRPVFTWKAATTLDGRIATGAGASQWITGETARIHGHRLRAEYDAIMIGSETALRDRPALTCRLPGRQGASPVRIVCDGQLRLDPESPLVVTAADVPTWVVTGTDADGGRIAALIAAGVTVIQVRRGPGGVDLVETAAELGRRGLTRVLVEGGGRLAGALLAAHLVDRIEWFRAAKVFGGDGLPAAAAFGVTTPDGAPAFRQVSSQPVGADMLETYVPADAVD